LREKLNDFRERITFEGYTEQQKQSIAKLFDTSRRGVDYTPPTSFFGKIAAWLGLGKASAGNWETQMFQMMPVAGAVTILTQLQNSIRATEGDALEYLKSQVDADDFRVNKIEAVVIPESKYVVRGTQFSAQIALVAMDTTQVPIVRVGNEIIPDGRFVRGAGAVGNQSFSGEIELVKRDGTSQFFPFKGEYIVGEPSSTISADRMNIFYAGIENPVSISVPGIPMSQISATMTNGNLLKTATGWDARPASINQRSVISVTANVGGRTIPFGSKEFRVKPLPLPVAFIEYKDNAGITQRYKGGIRFPKAQLLAAPGVRAALDDPDLDNIPFTVLGFEINFFDAMGNTIIELSNGNQFTDRQMAQMRGLASGRQFYITKTRAKGPDGLERTLPPIQVIVQ
jgi:gliding motility-associated protein GldM